MARRRKFTHDYVAASIGKAVKEHQERCATAARVRKAAKSAKLAEATGTPAADNYSPTGAVYGAAARAIVAWKAAPAEAAITSEDGTTLSVRVPTGKRSAHGEYWRKSFDARFKAGVPKGVEEFEHFIFSEAPDEVKVRFAVDSAKGEHSRLLKKADAATYAATWSLLQHAVALGDASAKPAFGTDAVYDRLCKRLADHTATKDKALAELKAFEELILTQLLGDEADEALNPRLPLDKRSKNLTLN